jgi:cellobiose phosphorylase
METHMTALHSTIDALYQQIDALLGDPEKRARVSMPGQTLFLDRDHVLCLPRDNGDSRSPYGHNGLNFWAFGSGYMYCNEGLFSIFSRASHGEEPRIAFFAALNGQDRPGTPWPLLDVPVLPALPDLSIQRYTVFAPSAVYYLTEAGHLRFGIRVFLSKSRELCFSIHMHNRSDNPVSLMTSCYFNPYLRHQLFETSEDIWFREIRLEEPAYAADMPVFRLMVNQDRTRTESITHTGILRRQCTAGAGGRCTRHEETTSRLQYVGGIRNDLHYPRSVVNGTFGSDPLSVTAFTDMAVMGDLLQWELSPGGTARVDMVFTWHQEDGHKAVELSNAIDPEGLDTTCDALKEGELMRQQGLAISLSDSADQRFNPDVFNPFIHHLRKQVEFCSLIKGYIQLSPMSLIGIRDVFQAIEGLLFWEPAAAEEKMIEALGFTTPQGRCFRQYSLPANGQPGRMDLRPFIDQGAWVISTVYTYLKVTGQAGFLSAQCGYYTIIDEKNGQVQPMDDRDSVLEHLIRIMDFLLDHRDTGQTGCVRAMYGDWNDALDGLGVSRDPDKEYGSGVSVMATLQVYQNTREMISMLEQVDAQHFAAKIKAYRQARAALEQALLDYAVVENDRGEKRILHGWGDARSYLVGSFDDPDHQARDGLTSNAFWVLSGMYERYPEFHDTILAAFERLDSKYGFKTFEPGFAPNTPGVGRIPKLPIGTAENAGAYIHATAFAIMALFHMGCPEKAWEQLYKILPFTDIHANLSHTPFVMPNSYGFNPEKNIDGENMNDWQTGSSNVVLKLLIRYVFGFEPMENGCWIQPAAWCPFNAFDFSIRYRQCMLHITWRRQASGKGSRTFIIDGQRHSGEENPLMKIHRYRLPPMALEDRKALHIEVIDE